MGKFHQITFYGPSIHFPVSSKVVLSKATVKDCAGTFACAASITSSPAFLLSNCFFDFSRRRSDANKEKRAAAMEGLLASKGLGSSLLGGADSVSAGIGNPLQALDEKAEEEVDPNSLVDGWEHDPMKMEIKFACSVLNWKGHLPKLKKDVLKVYAFYKQATQGDAPPPEERPFDSLGREKWEVWDKWRGTPKDVAKRRYITYLRQIDEKLVYVAVNEKPPFGFPRTRYKEKICARCNSVAGCLREVRRLSLLAGLHGEGVAVGLLPSHSLVSSPL